MADGLFGGIGSGLSGLFSGNKQDYISGVKSDGTKFTLPADKIAELEDATITNKFSTGSNVDLGGMAQLGGLGLSTYDSLFGAGSKSNKQALENAKKQSTLLSQQIASNEQSIADKKAFNAGMANASNKAMGLGNSLVS